MRTCKSCSIRRLETCHAVSLTIVTMLRVASRLLTPFVHFTDHPPRLRWPRVCPLYLGARGVPFCSCFRSTNKGHHTVFVFFFFLFLCLPFSVWLLPPSVMPSRSSRVFANGKIESLALIWGNDFFFFLSTRLHNLREIQTSMVETVVGLILMSV